MSVVFGGDAKFVSALQTNPEFGRRAEPMSEAKRRITCHSAIARNYLTEPFRGNVDLARKLGRRDADFIELLLQNLIGVNGSHQHI